ncbi:hypothetical protein D3C85_569560 [compost metagenome]
MEITRRRLASIISFLASREDDSPSFMRLLMSLSSVSGTTTRDWMSVSFCCSSCTGGMLRASTALQGLPAAACFSTHLRFSRLEAMRLPFLSKPLKSRMNSSCGKPHLSTMMRRSSRSFLRTSSTCVRTRSHSFSMVLAVKRMVISSSDTACWALVYAGVP